MKLGLNWLKSAPYLFLPRPKGSFGFLLQFLLMTSAIALSAGVGFGAAIRFSDVRPLGNNKASLSPQAFPPRQDWPISQNSSETLEQKP
jgi:hypothetical protein